MNRYFVDEHGVSHEHPDGAYCRYADMQERLEELKVEIETANSRGMAVTARVQQLEEELKKQHTAPYGWRTEVIHSRLRFWIGHQGFTIDYSPVDEPGSSAAEQLQWMDSMLQKALRRLAESVPEGSEIVDSKRLQHLRDNYAVKIQCQREEVWYWQGDGADFPESLGCPVVMSADTLRQLLASAGAPVCARSDDSSSAVQQG